jgi:Putative transposase
VGRPRLEVADIFDRHKTMTLETHEFIRRFLIHVLPKGFHRIRHYGLFANGARAETIARARELLAVAAPEAETDATATTDPAPSQTLAHLAPGAAAA